MSMISIAKVSHYTWLINNHIAAMSIDKTEEGRAWHSRNIAYYTRKMNAR